MEVKVNNHDFYWRVLFSNCWWGLIVTLILRYFINSLLDENNQDTLKNGDTWSQKD